VETILVLGSGGREHAIAWAARRTGAEVLLHPGNAGTRIEGFADLGGSSLSMEAIGTEAKKRNITLIVIGPEALLAEGYAEYLRERGFLVVGPNRPGARLETSKVFAKEFMRRADVPTAPFHVVDNETQLRAVVGVRWPVVLKLDGLAAGKGVVVANDMNDVESFVTRLWTEREFGGGPHRVVVEEFIPGHEVSYLGLCDGRSFIPLSSATDFKRIGDNDTGPNTGGMGAISPSPYFSQSLEDKIQSRIVAKVLTELGKEGMDYRGVLYLGLMVTAQGDPFVLEFNVRFGDPETQAILLRLESSFVEALKATATGTLSQLPPLDWKKEISIYVVGAAEGYPGKLMTGDLITGISSIGEKAQVFYSAVQQSKEGLVTAGGRVLGVGALGSTAAGARRNAYEAFENIRWRGKQYRTDIGMTKET